MPNRLRSTRTAVIFPHNGQLIVFDYLSKSAIAVTPEVIHWFLAFDAWSLEDEVIAASPGVDPDEARATIKAMIASGLLVGEATESAAAQSSYERNWNWGPLSAILHFGTQNLDFLPPDDSQKDSLAKAAAVPSPALSWHGRYEAHPTVKLPMPLHDRGYFETARVRRSSRSPTPQALTLAQLSGCLFAGLAVTAHVRMPTGDLPLKPTPSGGARNPYEAFVLVQNVEDLDRGFYHYSSLHHQLRLVSHALPNQPGDLLGQQDWANAMPAIVFLIAVLERSMWKYQEDSAYKVVLIEGGHIGQNIVMAAAAQGFSGCPTAAISHSLVASHLGLDQLTHTPVYAVALCHPGVYDAEVVHNPHMPHPTNAANTVTEWKR